MGRTLGPDNDDDNRRAKQPAAAAHTISAESMKKNLYNPTQPLPLAMRAKMDADRLWAQHQFNTMDLTTAPPFMLKPKTTVYEKAVALELAVIWRNTISGRMLQANMLHTKNMFTERYKLLRQWENRLEHEIQVMHAELTRLGREEMGHPANPSAVPKSPQATGSSRNAPKKPNKPPTASRARPARPKVREHNAGFGDSTKITFFRAPDSSMASGPKRAVENATQPGVTKQDGAMKIAVQPAHVPEPTHESSPDTMHNASVHYSSPCSSMQPATPTMAHSAVNPPPSHPHPSLNAAYMASPYVVRSPYTTSSMVPAGHVSRYTSTPHGLMPQSGASNGHGQMPQLGAPQGHA
jgi:hypothetical protein